MRIELQSEFPEAQVWATCPPCIQVTWDVSKLSEDEQLQATRLLGIAFQRTLKTLELDSTIPITAGPLKRPE